MAWAVLPGLGWLPMRFGVESLPLGPARVRKWSGLGARALGPTHYDSHPGGLASGPSPFLTMGIEGGVQPTESGCPLLGILGAMAGGYRPIGYGAPRTARAQLVSSGAPRG